MLADEVSVKNIIEPVPVVWYFCGQKGCRAQRKVIDLEAAILMIVKAFDPSLKGEFVNRYNYLYETVEIEEFFWPLNYLGRLFSLDWELILKAPATF